MASLSTITGRYYNYDELRAFLLLEMENPQVSAFFGDLNWSINCAVKSASDYIQEGHHSTCECGCASMSIDERTDYIKSNAITNGHFFDAISDKDIVFNGGIRLYTNKYSTWLNPNQYFIGTETHVRDLIAEDDEDDEDYEYDTDLILNARDGFEYMIKHECF